MNYRIKKHPIRGRVRAVTSKSDAHRALIAAALSDGETKLYISDINDDIDATAACLVALGASINADDGVYTVKPISLKKGATCSCKESGSTLRFLLPVAAALGADATFVGEGRLPQRPMSALTDALRSGGASISSDSLPITVDGRLSPAEYKIAGNVSSQYISGLLMALPLTCGDCKVTLTTPLESSPYVDMTLNTLRKFGVKWTATDSCYVLEPDAGYASPGEYKTEGDWSSAAFMLALGAIGGEVTVKGLDRASLQADCKIFDILSRYGADISVMGGAITVSRGVCKPIDIDVSSCPDLFPVLSVLAAAANGKSTLRGGSRLRLKESDRISSVAAMLTSLGGKAEELEDGLVVHGTGSLAGGMCDSAGDHRIAMSAAVAACISTAPVIIKGGECVAKSYPAFFEDLKSIGGNADVI